MTWRRVGQVVQLLLALLGGVTLALCATRVYRDVSYAHDLRMRGIAFERDLMFLRDWRLVVEQKARQQQPAAPKSPTP